MNPPSAETLLRVWEERHGAHPIRRALALLSAAWPEVGDEAWARATIGERDACLLWLYEHLFGTQLQTVAHCPRCGERLESSFTTADIRAQPPVLPAPHAPMRIRAQDYEIELRTPTSEDLLALAEAPQGAPGTQLLARCVSAALREGEAVDAAQLPMEVIERLATALAEHDPGAEIRVALSCPACAHAWTMGFDIVGYLWSELEDWAQRVLADVHQLASAYGWSERDILALSPTRRRLYLDMVRG